MKIYDQHLHSSYSKDSKGSLENYFKIAKLKKYEYVVTTEHLDYDNFFKEDWTVDIDKLEKEMIRLEDKYGVKHLLGLEAGFRKEHIDKTKKIISSYNFDVVNLSIHDDGIRDFYYQEYVKKEGEDSFLKAYFNYILLALNTFDDFDVLSHFDYGFKTAFLYNNNLSIEKYESFLKDIFSLIIRKDKALEINLKVEEIINSSKHLEYILNLYKEIGGVKLTLSSDSHKEEDYEKYYERIEKYLKIIKECGFNKLCYFVKRKTHFLDI